MGRGNDDVITYEKLYTFVDMKIGEVSKSVLRLESKFDSMESGRLTRLERDHAQLQADVSSSQGQIKATSFLIPLAISIFFAVINIILVFLNK